MVQSQIIISPKGRLMQKIPHYLLVNGVVLGIIKGEVHVSVPAGKYKMTIRSMYKFIETSFYVSVAEGESVRVSFSDRDRIWNRLFNFDLILWIMKRLLDVPEPWGTIYEVISNGFFAVWLIRIWIIRKHYFDIKLQPEKEL